MHLRHSSSAAILNEPSVCHLLDARHRACPQPILMLRQTLKPLAPGARVTLLTTDPMASVDVRAFCMRAGHRLLAESDAGDHAVFSVERG